MLTGKVVGSLVSTVKDDALKGVKLLVVRLIENGIPGKLIIAADAVRVAGIGDHVFVVGGREAAMGVGKGLIPVDAAITGIIDKYNLNCE